MIDPLLLPREELPDGADRASFAGVECAVAMVDTDPNTAEAQWSADREVVLTVTDRISADELAAVLPEFAAHARERADRPTDAVLTFPSRAIDLGRAARDAGFAPGGVLAVHDLRRPSTERVPDDRLAVRVATAADAAAVTRLWWDQAEYEARLGTLRVSAPIRAAIETDVPHRLAGDGVVLVAGTGPEQVAGVVVASSPAGSAWVAARLSAGPVSYLDMASTAPAHRGGGVGGALVAELHRRHRLAGVALSAVHYSTYNPLSVPFWSQQGYRPVLTHYAMAVRS